MSVHLFCGFDRRETVGFYVFLASVFDRATVPVVVRRMDALGLRKGSNEFTFSRFIVPFLMGFEGRAIFADASDMLMMSDIAELDRHFDPRCAVQVVKHSYTSRHPRKYIGTPMECENRPYLRKNWASLMLMNCGHNVWRGMTPSKVDALAAHPTQLLGLHWIPDSLIGALPDSWNRLVDEGQDVSYAKLLHFTAGLPCFPHYANTPGADLWRAQRALMLEAA